MAAKNRLIKHLILIVFLVTGTFVRAQNDSLLRIFDPLPNAAHKMDTAFKWAQDYIVDAQDLARFWIDTAIVFARQNNDKHGEGRCLFVLGLVEYVDGNFVKAMSVLKQSIVYLLPFGDSTSLAKTYNNLAMVYSDAGLYEEAIRHYHLSLKYVDKRNKDDFFSTQLNIASTLLYSSNDYAAAEKIFHTLLHEIPMSVVYPELTGIANNGLGYIQMNYYKNFDSAAFYYQRSLDALPKQSTYQRRNTTLNAAINETQRKNFKKAAAYLKETKNLLAVYNQTVDFADWHYYTASTYSAAKQYALMKMHIDTAHALLEIEPQLNSKSKLLFLESAYYKAIGNFEEALEKHMQAFALRDSVLNKDNLRQIATMRAVMDEERLQSENKTLVSERDLNAQKAAIEVQRRNGVLLFLTLVLGFLLLMLQRYREKNKLNNKLENLNKALDNNKKALEAANNAKDQFFGILSHDLRNPLMAFEELSKFLSEEVDAALTKEKTALTQMHQHATALRQTLNNLLMWSKNEQGLIQPKKRALLLREVVDEAVQLFMLPMSQKKLQLLVEVDEAIVVFMDREALRTVVRNLVNNSIKFTDTGGIHIWSKPNGDSVLLIVADTGSGFDKSKLDASNQMGLKNGLGLLLCRQLLAQNNAHLDIQTTTKKGTTVTIALPLYSIEE